MFGDFFEKRKSPFSIILISKLKEGTGVLKMTRGKLKEGLQNA